MNRSIAEDRPPRAKLVGGVWLPATEHHLEHMMIRNPKANRIVDGKATYQFKKLEAALLQCKGRRIAVDIGAHCGLWSMWLVRHFEHVHAFEPIPMHQAIFPFNMGEHTNYTLHKAAVGEQDTTITMRIPLDTTGSAHVASKIKHPGFSFTNAPGVGEEIPDVRMVRLDSMDLPDADFIKIDVEGLERAVIAGGEKYIRRSKPIMVVEEKGNAGVYGARNLESIDLLKSWGAKTITVISGDHIIGWDE